MVKYIYTYLTCAVPSTSACWFYEITYTAALDKLQHKEVPWPLTAWFSWCVTMQGGCLVKIHQFWRSDGGQTEQDEEAKQFINYHLDIWLGEGSQSEWSQGGE